MRVKEKLIDFYVNAAWDIVVRDDVSNLQKVRILNTIIYDDIPDIKYMDKVGIW